MGIILFPCYSCWLSSAQHLQMRRDDLTASLMIFLRQAVSSSDHSYPYSMLRQRQPQSHLPCSIVGLRLIYNVASRIERQTLHHRSHTYTSSIQASVLSSPLISRRSSVSSQSSRYTWGNFGISVRFPNRESECHSSSLLCSRWSIWECLLSEVSYHDIRAILIQSG